MLSLKQEKMVYRGVVFKIGNNINTDLLHPSEFFSLNNDTVKNGFLKGVSNWSGITENHIIVAGKNFGCGSSRETTAYAFKLNNINIIIATSFSRIFYRNMINNGIIPLIQPNLHNEVNDGDLVEVDLVDMQIKLHNTTVYYTIKPFDDYIIRVLNKNGMVHYLKDYIKYTKKKKVSHEDI